MIEFEGFGLENTEQNIINKQFSTQPRILKQFMTALGAKEGSSSTKRYEWQTEDQKDLWKDTLGDYKNLEYQGPGEFNEGTKADDLEGFKATSFDQLRRLKDEGRLSLEGLNKLRNYGATAATQVNPDIEALRGLGDTAWSGFDNQLRENVGQARKKLGEQDILARRSGVGGSALQRLGSQNVMEYGKTVGDASARAVEQSAMQRQQLAMQSRMQAGQLGLGATQQGLQGLNIAQSGELGQLSLDAQDLSQRRGIHSQERQYQGQNELQRARYSAERADAKNLWQSSNAANRNQWDLSRLRDQTTAANTRTFEDVVTKTRGSAGFGGALISAAGTVGGAYVGGMYGNPQLGASIGGSLAGSLVNSSGDWGGGGGGGPSGGGGFSNAMNAGVNAYAAGGGFSNTGYNAPVPQRATGGNTSWSGYDAGEFGGGGDRTGMVNPWQATNQFQDDPWNAGVNFSPSSMGGGPNPYNRNYYNKHSNAYNYQPQYGGY